jgi:hypothetical protein
MHTHGRLVRERVASGWFKKKEFRFILKGFWIPMLSRTRIPMPCAGFSNHNDSIVGYNLSRFFIQNENNCVVSVKRHLGLVQ